MNSSSRGTSALGLLTSISIGTFITLGYANISHYVAAKNALEQSAALTMRCLTPTDPVCVKLSPQPAVSSWHYFGTVGSASGESYGREFDYSATMFRTRYGFDAEYYRIPQRFQPLLEVDSVTLPLAVFVRRTLRKNVTATYRYEADLPWNRAVPSSPAFPAWNVEIEKDHDTEPFSAFQNESRLSAGERLLRAAFVPVFTRSFDFQFGAGQSDLGSTLTRTIALRSPDPIALSRLIGGETKTSSCVRGESCNVSGLASPGNSGDANDYLRRRFLALYLQVHLTRVSTGVQLGVQGDGGAPGFSISTSAGHRINLGGRDLQAVEALEGKYFNLWLRGPRGARGSSDTDSAEHSDLEIPIGGSFSPEIYLRAEGTNGDSLRGEVTLFAFADSYRPQSGVDHVAGVCPPVTVAPGESLEDASPSLALCGLSAATTNFFTVLLHSDEEQLGCSDSSASWPAAIEVPKSGSVDIPPAERQVVALCSGDEKPTAFSACGWAEDGASFSELQFSSPESARCPRAISQPSNTALCNTVSQTVSACDLSVTPESCSSYPEQKNFYDGIIASARLRGVGIPDILSQRNLAASLLPGEVAPDLLSCDPPPLASGCASLEKRLIETIPRWEELVPPTDPSQFDLPPDFEPITGCISDQAHGSRALDAPVPTVVTGYPFDGGAEIELSSAMPQRSAKEIDCSDPAEHASTLEELLRRYAALNGYEAAANSDVRFEFYARDLHSERLVSRTMGCRTEDVTGVHNCAQLNFRPFETEHCTGSIDLGVFAGNLGDPPQCAAPGMTCSRVPELLSEPLPTFPTDLQLASQQAAAIGRQILKRYLPNLADDCSSEGCGTIAVDISDPEVASVSASYELPLAWPMDLLLHRKTVHLEITRRERFEAQ